MIELDANGDLPTTTFSIISEPREGGANATITVNAQLPDFNITKPVEGGLVFRVRFRIISDTVTVS